MDIDAIKALVAQDFHAVDALISQSLRSEVPLINEIAQHIIQSGGKRLRPLVVLLSARACGYDGHHHITIAAIIEFIHTATLLHDDVVDRSDLRRGQPSANAMWDNSAPVLVGDFLYSRAFQLMVNVGQLQVMDVLAEASNLIAQGEVLQLLSRGNPATTEEEYRRVIQYKTATLFEAAAQLGAILSFVESEPMMRFGRHLGIAFQMMDDTLDFTAEGEQLGKQPGDDLADGKPTLPLIHLLKNGSHDEQTLAREALLNPSRQHLSAIRAAVESRGGIEYTKSCALIEAQSAQAALEHLADSPYKSAALSLCRFAVERNF